MEAGLLNSLVGDYLASLGSKLAEKFKKETKAAPLPPGSPGLKEIVKHFNTSPQKRKLELTNGNSPAKKSKKVRISYILKCLNHVVGLSCPRGSDTACLGEDGVDIKALTMTRACQHES